MPIYAECRHIKRQKPSDAMDENIAKAIGLNYRTIPTFEKGLFEHRCIEHYSLERNELLHCRWRTYLNCLAGRVFSPFQFPDKRDLHFYNGAIKYEPTLSIHRVPTFRRKLKPGPGVDIQGQMPIPQELLMKRGTAEKEDGGHKKRSIPKKNNVKSK